MDLPEVRAPASSPAPSEFELNLDDVVSPSFGLSFGDGPETERSMTNQQQQQRQLAGDETSRTIGDVDDANQDGFQVPRWVMFANSAQAMCAMEIASSEYRTIRDQIMEELEWQKQGLFNDDDGRAWMAERDAELKALRLKLAAKRGWDAIRRYIQDQREDKRRLRAQAGWTRMFRIAREAAQIGDKVRLDLYERYGFLGWTKKKKIPPFNPMFPDKSMRLAQERASILHQIATDQEEAEMNEKFKAYMKHRKTNDAVMALTSRSTQMTPSSLLDRRSSMKRNQGISVSTDSLLLPPIMPPPAPLISPADNNSAVFNGFSRAVTLLSLTTAIKNRQNLQSASSQRGRSSKAVSVPPPEIKPPSPSFTTFSLPSSRSTGRPKHVKIAVDLPPPPASSRMHNSKTRAY